MVTGVLVPIPNCAHLNTMVHVSASEVLHAFVCDEMQ